MMLNGYYWIESVSDMCVVVMLMFFFVINEVVDLMLCYMLFVVVEWIDCGWVIVENVDILDKMLFGIMGVVFIGGC